MRDYNSLVSLVASPDWRVTLHPFAGYRALAERPEQGAWVALRGPLKWLLVVSCFVALTTSGRFTLDHLLLSPLAWSFAPLWQCAWLLLVRKLFGVSASLSHTVDLYYRGHLPWLLALLLLAAICLLAPDVWGAFRWLLVTRLLLVLLLVAQSWCVLLSYALFRSGLELSRRKAVAATLLFYVGFWGSLAAYYGVVGQLGPVLGFID